ncbi:hypothetical protein [Butyrivibrio sp.]|nr:hypothetical protein [Butyrivibrio sp.]
MMSFKSFRRTVLELLKALTFSRNTIGKCLFCCYRTDGGKEDD